jgi:CHRD domain
MRSRTTLAASLAVAAVAALVVAVSGTAKDGSSDDDPLFAALSGQNEIGPNGKKGAGDPDGRGSFSATVEGNQICYGLTVKNISNPVAAHIHRGKPSENGPVVVPLTPPSSGDPGASSGCATAERSLLEDILKHPNHYYSNVHTPDFPGGAVRGQLSARNP